MKKERNTKHKNSVLQTIDNFLIWLSWIKKKNVNSKTTRSEEKK